MRLSIGPIRSTQSAKKMPDSKASSAPRRLLPAEDPPRRRATTGLAGDWTAVCGLLMNGRLTTIGLKNEAVWRLVAVYSVRSPDSHSVVVVTCRLLVCRAPTPGAESP